MSANDEYKHDHKLAKAITCFVVIMLLVLSRVFSGVIVLDVLAVIVWFFLTNPLAYLIEKIEHHRHKHDLI